MTSGIMLCWRMTSEPNLSIPVPNTNCCCFAAEASLPDVEDSLASAIVAHLMEPTPCKLSTTCKHTPLGRLSQMHGAGEG